MTRLLCLALCLGAASMASAVPQFMNRRLLGNSTYNGPPNPCACAAQWVYPNVALDAYASPSAYSGCSTTPDWNTTWCYVADAYWCGVNSPNASKVSVNAGESRRWKECTECCKCCDGVVPGKCATPPPPPPRQTTPCQCKNEWTYNGTTYTGCDARLGGAEGKDYWCYVESAGCDPTGTSATDRPIYSGMGALKTEKWAKCTPPPCQCKSTSGNQCTVTDSAKCLDANGTATMNVTTDDCGCQKRWIYAGKTYEGCARTDTGAAADNKWCYVNNGYKCTTDEPSTDGGSERKWKWCDQPVRPDPDPATCFDAIFNKTNVEQCTCQAPLPILSHSKVVNILTTVTLKGLDLGDFTTEVQLLFRKAVAKSLQPIYAQMSYANVLISKAVNARRDPDSLLNVDIWVITGSTNLKVGQAAAAQMNAFFSVTDATDPMGFLAEMKRQCDNAGLTVSGGCQFTITAVTIVNAPDAKIQKSTIPKGEVIKDNTLFYVGIGCMVAAVLGGAICCYFAHEHKQAKKAGGSKLEDASKASSAVIGDSSGSV